MTEESEGIVHRCDDSLDPPYKACGKPAPHKRSYSSRMSRLAGQPTIVFEWFCDEHVKRHPLPEVRVPLLDQTERELLRKASLGTISFRGLNPTDSVVLERVLESLEKRGLLQFYLDTPYQPLCGPRVKITPAGLELLAKESAS